MHKKWLKAFDIQKTIVGTLNAVYALIDTKTQHSSSIACAKSNVGNTRTYDHGAITSLVI